MRYLPLAVSWPTPSFQCLLSWKGSPAANHNGFLSPCLCTNCNNFSVDMSCFGHSIDWQQHWYTINRRLLSRKTIFRHLSLIFLSDIWGHDWCEPLFIGWNRSTHWRPSTHWSAVGRNKTLFYAQTVLTLNSVFADSCAANLVFVWSKYQPIYWLIDRLVHSFDCVYHSSQTCVELLNAFQR